MANPRPIAANPSSTEYLELDRSNNLALPVPDEEAPGADQIPDCSLPVAVDEDLGAIELPEEFGDWKDDYADAVGISRWREL